MPLDPAFVAVAQRCAPTVPADLLAAVVSIQSNFSPLMVRVDARMMPAAASAGEAVSIAIEHIDQSARVQLGFAGLEETTLRGVGLGLVDAFDGCQNLRALGQILEGDAPGPATNGPANPDAERVMLQRLIKTGAVTGDPRTYVARVEGARTALAPTVQSLVAETAKRRATATSTNRPVSVASAPAAPIPAAPPAVPELVTPRTAPPTAPAWDVYGSARGAGVMVFTRLPQSKDIP